jgi:hypothetical protein
MCESRSADTNGVAGFVRYNSGSQPNILRVQFHRWSGWDIVKKLRPFKKLASKTVKFGAGALAGHVRTILPCTM